MCFGSPRRKLPPKAVLDLSAWRAVIGGVYFNQISSLSSSCDSRSRGWWRKYTGLVEIARLRFFCFYWNSENLFYLTKYFLCWCRIFSIKFYQGLHNCKQCPLGSFGLFKFHPSLFCLHEYRNGDRDILEQCFYYFHWVTLLMLQKSLSLCFHMW